MNRKGVLYDVGRVLGVNWRPHFDPKVVHRELSLIKNDLCCTAVKICGRDITRLMIAAEDALAQGLEVWLSPEMWNTGQKQTLAYLVKAARASESLRKRWPERVIFSVGTEATLFQRGFIKGWDYTQRIKRIKHPSFREQVKSGRLGQSLNAFLRTANEVVREVFHGPVTYSAAVPLETVDWSPFDFVCIDAYRGSYLPMPYGDFITRYCQYGKPVIIGEFGCCTYQGAAEAGALGHDIVDYDQKRFLLHRLPFVGRWVRQRLKGEYVRDESVQASALADQLRILDDGGVEGAFVHTFVSPIFPYHDHPRYDLDMANYSLVKSYENGRRGTTYPDMPWEPKKSFQVVADYYIAH